jgi:hypothetical protein
VKSVALVLGQIAVIAAWVYAEFDLGALIFCAYLFVPWAVLTFGARSLRATARGIAILLITAMTVGMYLAIWTDDSSTAVLGFLWLPLYQLLAIGAVVWLQRQPRGTRKPDGPKAPERSRT